MQCLRLGPYGRLKHAITFIELLLVTFIIGIIAAVSIPAFRKTFNNLELKSFSGQLQSFIRYLQQRSLAEAKIIYLRIDNETKRCWAEMKDGQVNVLKSYSIPKGIEVKIIIEDTSTQRIVFYPDGQLDSATIKLTNPEKREIILNIQGAIGKVKVQQGI
ncbi:MAG: hypothetical protein NC908_02785 [Candidatus Omnitrophica bacterium]|nr:hypothetical protein [Candidatus Omnitrophota bacterium]